MKAITSLNFVVLFTIVNPYMQFLNEIVEVSLQFLFPLLLYIHLNDECIEFLFHMFSFKSADYCANSAREKK